jgi:hypothetical protein
MKITESKLRQIIRESIHEELFTIPAEWLTRKVLEDVGNAYLDESESLPETKLGGVIWDKLHDLGIEVSADGSSTFPLKFKIEQGSKSHCWIVLDAIESAEALLKGPADPAGLEVVKKWVADPSEKNRRDVANVITDLKDDSLGLQHADPEAAAARFEKWSATISAAYAAAYPQIDGLDYAASAASDYHDARTRFRVLNALDSVGILPAPKV